MKLPQNPPWCPSCWSDVDADDRYCPSCNEDLSKNEPLHYMPDELRDMVDADWREKEQSIRTILDELTREL